MASRRRASSVLKLKQSRAAKIFALVPNIHACSEGSGDSESDHEIPNRSYCSLSSSSSSIANNSPCDGFLTSPAPSLESSLERLGNTIFKDDDEISEHNDCNPEPAPTEISQSLPKSPSILHGISEMDIGPLTPIINKVFPNNTNEINYNNIPSVSSFPSLNSEQSTPQSTVKNKKKVQAHLTTRQTRLQFRKKLKNIDTQSTTTSKTAIKRKSTNKVILSPSKKKAKKVAKSDFEYTWKRAVVFKYKATCEETDDNYEDLLEGTENSPLAYFYRFFSPEILEHILHYTNLYSIELTGKSMQLTMDELKNFLAIQIIMGIVRMPAYIDYWSEGFRYNLVADVMTLKRYQQIRRHLHFVDNYLDDGDRYYKVRPILQMVRENCLKLDNNDKCYSIDEMMIPYKGKKAGKRKQYMKDKPNKWGFKNFARASLDGMIRDFLLYGGEDTFRFHNFTKEEEGLGFGAKIVIALCQSIKKKPSFVFCDNYFTSPELFNILKRDYGIFGLGTIRSNRMRGAEKVLPVDKTFKKTRRGSHAQVVCNKNKLSIVKWNDNKPVTLISSYVGADPVSKIKRYCKEAKAKVDVECPMIVKEYNKYMGGVDLADMLISLYKIRFKSNRWYMGIFAQLVDICLNNAWLLFRKTQKKTMNLKHFRREVYEELKKLGISVSRVVSVESKVNKPTIPRPSSPIKYDDIGHFPDIGNERGRCRNCQQKTNVFCIKCNMRLCFVPGKDPRNCFLSFHTKK